MRRGRSLAWKLSAAVIVIVAGTLLATVAVDQQLIGEELQNRGLYTVVFVAGAVALSVLTMVVLIQRMLRRPIQRLIDGTQRLAEGERDFRFPGVRGDEFGELECAFNRMTERINADASELSEAKDYLEGVIENSAAIIITVNLDHQIQTFNTGAEQILGFNRSEVIGQKMRTLFVRGEDRDKALEILENQDNVRNFETQFKTKSGEARDVLLTLSRLHDREGNLIGTFGISKDITKEKELLRQLVYSRDYLEGVIENSADIIITVNLDHEIQTFNTGAEQALGFTRREVIGQRMRTLFVRPEDRDEALAMLEDENSVRNYATQFKTKSGAALDVLLTLSRLHDREGNLIGTFGISKDITKEKELLRQLIQSKKLIAIGQAVTGINHATKNILNALTGGRYLVRSGMNTGNEERLTEGWAMVEDGIEKISGLSKNLLAYARGWKSEIEDCDLGELVWGVADSLVNKARGQGIELRSDPTNGLEPIRCDPKLLRTTIMDIASNAIDACADKDYEEGETPFVSLKVHPPDGEGRVVVEISDNGCGMDELTVNRVFEPFFSTKAEGGTGVGLAMASRIIEEHGGRCDVESTLDEGSTFRIILPGINPEDGKESTHG